MWEAFDRERFKVGVRVCYCSVLEDCWVSTTDRADEPVAVASCAEERAALQYQ